MKNTTFAKRLTQALKIRGITAAEFSRRMGISEAVISQYRSGKYEPKQDRLDEFAKALDVSEGWLMGYDVPMERKSREENKKPAEDGELAEDMAIIAELVSRLTPEQLDPVITMIENMPRLNPDQLSSIAEVIKNMAK